MIHKLQIFHLTSFQTLAPIITSGLSIMLPSRSQSRCLSRLPLLCYSFFLLIPSISLSSPPPLSFILKARCAFCKLTIDKDDTLIQICEHFREVGMGAEERTGQWHHVSPSKTGRQIKRVFFWIASGRNNRQGLNPAPTPPAGGMPRLHGWIVHGPRFYKSVAAPLTTVDCTSPRGRARCWGGARVHDARAKTPGRGSAPRNPPSVRAPHGQVLPWDVPKSSHNFTNVLKAGLPCLASSLPQHITKSFDAEI